MINEIWVNYPFNLYQMVHWKDLTQNNILFTIEQQFHAWFTWLLRFLVMHVSGNRFAFFSTALSACFIMSSHHFLIVSFLWKLHQCSEGNASSVIYLPFSLLLHWFEAVSKALCFCTKNWSSDHSNSSFLPQQTCTSRFPPTSGGKWMRVIWWFLQNKVKKIIFQTLLSVFLCEMSFQPLVSLTIQLTCSVKTAFYCTSPC